VVSGPAPLVYVGDLGANGGTQEHFTPPAGKGPHPKPASTDEDAKNPKEPGLRPPASVL
jgi:hypothetical protein